MRAATARVEAQTRPAKSPASLDQQLADIWAEQSFGTKFSPNPEKKAKEWDKEMDVHRGGYLGDRQAPRTRAINGPDRRVLLAAGSWRCSRMLLGMGLMKLGVFSAQRSRRFYLWMVALGYGVGLPLMVFDAIELIRHRFSFDYMLHGGAFYNLFGSLVVALGHVGLLMLIVQSGAITWLTGDWPRWAAWPCPIT